ncbi:MAG: DUF6273 domain-containing protein, partial [Spirochaetaceae bacterium]|nr:DUF6273 domain-containing protein [Spirochaetaceae bacterium]
DTFTQIHEYLKAFSNKTDLLKNGRIKLGDYVDLAGLVVTGYGSGGAINETTNQDLGGSKGKLLRIIVVGINSFNPHANNAGADYAGGVTSPIPHIVMQFQNIPVTRGMNDTSMAYEGSEMRTYLKANFTEGLKLAGVPMYEGTIIWGPTRKITNTVQNGTDTITDTLWLPTEREIFNSRTYSNDTYETPADQAYLEYYTGDPERVKYNTGEDQQWYWESSPFGGNSLRGCAVNPNGSAGNGAGTVSYAGGVAPAFCVK